MKVNLYMSEPGWEGLKQRAYDTHYVRAVSRADRPRGVSAFISAICLLKYVDTRPEYLRDTGQWITGVDGLKQRCLELSGPTMADLGLIALEHSIYTFKSQLPVANGYRQHAKVPVLHAPGATPRGGTSVLALAGPVLEAIGLGYLTPVGPFPMAPPNLYQGPSRRYTMRQRRSVGNRSMF